MVGLLGLLLGAVACCSAVSVCFWLLLAAFVRFWLLLGAVGLLLGFRAAVGRSGLFSRSRLRPRVLFVFAEPKALHRGFVSKGAVN